MTWLNYVWSIFSASFPLLIPLIVVVFTRLHEPPDLGIRGGWQAAKILVASSITHLYIFLIAIGNKTGPLMQSDDFIGNTPLALIALFLFITYIAFAGLCVGRWRGPIESITNSAESRDQFSFLRFFIATAGLLVTLAFLYVINISL